MFIVQVSPYPPEAGSDYHEQLAYELMEKTRRPVLTLAGLTHLDASEAMKSYGRIEKRSGIIVYRAFWAPRIAGPGNSKVLKYVVASLKALAQTITVAKRYSGETITHFHYGPTTWPGAFLGEHYPLGMVLARIMGAKVIWTIHAFLVPYQLYQEVKEQGSPPLLALPLIAYYLLLAKIAARACHRIIVLVDSPNAPITDYLRKLLGKSKVTEQMHPPFKPLITGWEDNVKDKITIVCLGYIRKGKGYHYLLRWLTNLKKQNKKLYSKIEVIIAGTVDRKEFRDLLYFKSLIHIISKYNLHNVKLIPKRLNNYEFNEILAKSTIVWCAYEKKYGPSGILAWARAYNKRAILPARTNIWQGS